MRRLDDELRAAWRSLAEVEDDLPGHDHDRGSLTGWYDSRRGIRKRIAPDGDYRDPDRVAEFRRGYDQGREDGEGRATDWWPDHALGRMVDDASPERAIPGTGEPVRLRLKAAHDERVRKARAAADRRAADMDESVPGAA